MNEKAIILEDAVKFLNEYVYTEKIAPGLRGKHMCEDLLSIAVPTKNGTIEINITHHPSLRLISTS